MARYGIIGYPLLFSFSKNYFEEKFKKEKISGASFHLFPLKEIKEFTDLLVKEPALTGLAVTIPHKQAVIPFLTELHESAKDTGAVNCIKFSGEKRIGYNTDSFGFEKSFLPLLKPQHKKALVLGTGGASKAVLYILKKNGIEFLLVSRNNTGENTINYSDVDAALLKEYHIVINCTPAGMMPDEDSKPAIPYDLLTPDHLLYDLVYKPLKTKFLEEGEKRGCDTKNGMEMLLIQAEENWKIWND